MRAAWSLSRESGQQSGKRVEHLFPRFAQALCWLLLLCPGRGLPVLATGLATDVSMAARILRDACNSGDADSCFHFGQLLDAGEEGLFPDRLAALQFYHRGCRGQQAQACLELGKRMVPGDAQVVAHPEMAMEALAMACELGLEEACRHLKEQQEIWEQKGPEPPQAFLEQLRYRCLLHEADACLILARWFMEGAMLRHSVNGEWDVRECLERACVQGSTLGCLYWGLHLAGLSSDEPVSGSSWDAWEEACSQGSRPACSLWMFQKKLFRWRNREIQRGGIP